MTDFPQILLLAVITILTILLIVLGIQIFFVLKESKETLKKVNEILDSASSIAENASKQVSFFSNPLVKLLVGTALTFFVGQKKIKEARQQKKEEPVRRFFKRSNL